MYTDIEKKLNKITDSLKEELLKANAIDENGRAIDVKRFNQIIDEKIAQCNEVLATTEKDGVTKDLYGANITYARINGLEKAKKHRMLNPESVWFDQEEKAVAKKSEKTSGMKTGIKKVFAMFQSKFGKTNNSGKNSR